MRKSKLLIVILLTLFALPLAAQEMPHGQPVKNPPPNPVQQKKTCAYCGITMHNVTYPWQHEAYCPYFRPQSSGQVQHHKPSTSQVVTMAAADAITTAVGRELANEVGRAIDEYTASASRVYTNNKPGESWGEGGRYVVGIDELSWTNKCGVYDNNMRRWQVKPRYQDLRLVSMEAAIAVKGDKVGLLNCWTSDLVVPLEYDLWSFDNNCYFSALGRYTGTERKPSYAEQKKHSVWGVWDYKGKNIIPVQYDSIHFVGLNYDGKLVLSIIVFKDGKQGLCDYDGDLVLQPEYTWVSGVRKVQGEYCIGTLRDGYCALYDAAGKALTPHKYPWLSVSQTGVVAREQGRGTYGMLDGKGRTVIPFVYDTIRGVDVVDSLRRKLGISQMMIVEKEGHWGVRSLGGEELLPVRYAKDIRVLNKALSRLPDYSYSWYLRKRAAQIINTKGEFETTAEFEARKKDSAIQQNHLENELKNSDRDFLRQQLTKHKLSLLLGEYNADEGCFTIVTPGYSENGYKLYIKREDAKQFKEAFGKMREAAAENAKCFIDSDFLAVAELQFEMPDGRTYIYVNPAVANYDGTIYTVYDLK